MRNITIFLAASAALALSGCNNEPAEMSSTAEPIQAETVMTELGTIVEVAQGNPDFSTLVEAVVAADLAETLSGAGPFTVFAPTDTAFAKLPDGTLESLTQPENKGQLSSILTYHVIAGETMAAALLTAIEQGDGTVELTTVNGAKLSASISGGNVILKDRAGNSATVTATDVEASNGIVHVIDTVLMPE